MLSALSWKLQADVSYAVVAKAVGKFIDFEALVYWLRPLFRGAKDLLPPHVTLELKQESPSLLEFASKETSAAYKNKSRRWQRLFTGASEHVLSHAQKDGWLDRVLLEAGIHPRHVRCLDYA